MLRQTEIAYLTVLGAEAVQELDQAVNVAECLVHEKPGRKATVTFAVGVEHNAETGKVETVFKIRLSHVHKEAQNLSSVLRNDPEEGDDDAR